MVDIRHIFRLLAFAYVVFAAGMALVQRDLLYPGAGREFGHVVLPPDVQEVQHRVDGQPLRGWLIRARGSRGLVVFLHGNGTTARHEVDYTKRWTEVGYDLLLVEYRGFDGVEGKPSQDALVADTAALIHHVCASLVRCQQTIYHGHSLGGGVAAALALQARKPTAMVLESTFTTIRDFAPRFGLPGFLVVDPYDTHRSLEKLKVPVLILHGTQDAVVPVEQARLNAKTGARTTFIERPGSHRLPPNVAYWEILQNWLEAERLGK